MTADDIVKKLVEFHQRKKSRGFFTWNGTNCHFYLEESERCDLFDLGEKATEFVNRPVMPSFKPGDTVQVSGEFVLENKRLVRDAEGVVDWSTPEFTLVDFPAGKGVFDPAQAQKLFNVLKPAALQSLEAWPDDDDDFDYANDDCSCDCDCCN